MSFFHGLIVGVDPGLVHTGVVVYAVDEATKQIEIHTYVVEGDEPHAWQIRDRLARHGNPAATRVFVEGYRERGQSYGTNPGMRQLLADIRRELPKASVINNTGVKKVVRQPLLKVLGLSGFPTTHHQDLEAAARILVYGALKDKHLNQLVTEILEDHLAKEPWHITKEF